MNPFISFLDIITLPYFKVYGNQLGPCGNISAALSASRSSRNWQRHAEPFPQGKFVPYVLLVERYQTVRLALNVVYLVICHEFPCRIDTLMEKDNCFTCLP